MQRMKVMSWWRKICYGRSLFIFVPIYGFATTVMAATQTSSPEDTVSTEKLILLMVKEGGAWATVAILLWFYRRDWHRLSDQTEQLISIVEHSANVHERVAVALSANTEVLRRLDDDRRPR
jgi:hypothetical protein